MPKKTRILMLEDNPGDVELIKAELKEAKIEFEAIIVATEQKFVNVLRDSPPDVILSDYALPQFDGITAMVIALRVAPWIPFIIVTGSMDEETAVECMKAGATDYVLKQHLGRLGPAVKHALERRQASEEKQQAENALRKSEELFRSLVENINEIFYVVDMKGRVAYGSPNLFTGTGYSPDELLGHSYTRLVYDDDRHRIVDFYKARTNDGTVDTMCEFRARTKGGKPIWVEQTTRIIRDKSGAAIEYRNIVRNITERKLAEEALRKSETRYRMLFDKNPLPMWVYDLETLQFLAVNDAAVKHYGYSREEFLSMTLKEIRPKEEIPVLLENISKARSGIDQPGTWKHRRKDGEVINVEITAHGITFAGRKARLVLANDVTERKRAEEALTESEERYRSLFENMLNGFAYCRMLFEGDRPQDFVYLAVNHAFETLTGLKNVVGKKVSEVIPGIREADPGLFEIYGRVARSGVPERFETYVQALQMWFDISVFSAGNDHFVAVFDVITERKKAEEQLTFQAMLLDQVHQAVVAADSAAKITYWNSYAESMYGWRAFEAIGKSAFELLVPAEVVPVATKLLQTVVESGFGQGEFVVRRKDGHRFPVQFTAAVVKDANGKAIGFVSGSMDITERKRAEEALRQAEEKYHAIFENAMNGIFQTSPEGKFLTANPAMARMLGYESPEELIKGRTDIARQGYVHPERRKEFQQQIEKDGYVVGFEYQVYRKDGSIMWISENARPIRDAKGTIVYYEGFFEDIDERKKVEEALEENEKLLKQAQHIASLGHYIFDVATGMWTNSEVLDEVFGIDPTYQKNVEGWLAIVHPEERAEIAAYLMDHVVKAGNVFDREYRIVRISDRVERWVHGLGNLEFNSKGKAIRMFGVIQDVTERKKAEEARLESETRFRELFDHAPIGYHEIDAKGIITRVNRTECEMLGYSPEEMVGRPVWEFNTNPEASRKSVAEKFSRMAPIKPYERTLVRKDGSHLTVSVQDRYLATEQGTIIGIRTTIQDITDRKRAEEELLRQTAYFRQLFESSPYAIVLLTTNDHILDINKAFTSIFQYTLDECKGRSLSDLIVPGDKLKEANELSQQRARGEVVQKEIVRRRKNGEPVEVALTAYPIVLEQKQVGVFAIYVDISERKRLETELRQSQKLESLGTLAGGIAHDFNNILGIILGHVSLVERVSSDPAKIAASAEAISNATQRGAALVRQLLTFARKADIQFEFVQVNSVALELQKLLQETFPKIIVVNLQLDERLPLIKADATQVHQVLINLCVNARDAMMPAGGELTMSTRRIGGGFVQQRFHNAEAQEYILLSISDTGSGMDEATRNRIFEPFFTTKEIGKGTGLGLSTVYGIIQSHAGFIDVDSVVGRGTTFHLYFPVQSPRVKPEEQTVEKPEVIQGGTETILLVEDEDMLRELATMVLRAKGYTILQARDGEEGIQVFQEHHKRVSLVLSDIGLPKIGGYEMFARFQKINPGVPVVFASGYLEPELKSEIFKSGVKDFIQKPFIPSVLLKKIRLVLDDAARVPAKD